MVPAANMTFFTDSAAAAGALIGLLFVAISLRTESVFGDYAPISGRALAGSSFTALVNAFFISLMASIPDVSLGIVVIVLAILALYNTAKLHRHLTEREAHGAVDLQHERRSCAGRGRHLAHGTTAPSLLV